MAYNERFAFTHISRELSSGKLNSLDHTEKLLGIGKHTLLKSVKIATGKTFRQFRNEIVVRKVGELFREYPSFSIKQIAFAAGFASQGAFCRFIKSHTGLTPL